MVGLKVRFIGEGSPTTLLNGKIYNVVSIPIDAPYYEITDETGEDYCYPMDLFEVVEDNRK